MLRILGSTLLDKVQVKPWRLYFGLFMVNDNILVWIKLLHL